jgi:cytochrome c553
MKHYLILSFAVALCLAGGNALANEEAADDSGFSFEDKLASCSACHGANGDKPLAPDYPVLAGQYKDYLEQALKAYRSGRRQNPIMTMQVEMLKLSDSDIQRLAAHFSSKTGLKDLSE